MDGVPAVGRRGWVVLVVTTAALTGALIGGRAWFSRLFRAGRPAVSTAHMPVDAYEVGIYDLPSGCPVPVVRSWMGGYGPFRLVPGTGGRDPQDVCGQSPLGHATGWQATFEFEAGRLVRTRFKVLDNPDL